MAQSRTTGWLRYVDHTGAGLSNQGWKDSHDSVQFADGRLAEPPIALCEVQAYAYDAAVRGAALLDGVRRGRRCPGCASGPRDLRDRFADAFWVGEPADGHSAIALDARRPPGRLGDLQHGSPARHRPARPGRTRPGSPTLLADPRLDSGFGLRTLASDSPRFSRLSYHGGTVWPHDTAIAVRGLAADGHRDEAARLARGLFVAAEGFDYRLPELYGGDAAADVPLPSAYPAACRPQAWSAAAPLAALVAVTGVVVDAAAGVVAHPVRTSTALGAFSLRGLKVGEERLDVHVDADGAVRSSSSPAAGCSRCPQTHLR